MATREDGASGIVELVESCLEEWEEGGDVAVEAFLRAHPEHAADIRKRLAALRRSGMLDEHREPLPERICEFRILERIGAGGMGVVFAAEQESLGRRVALKIVRPEHLYFDKARERFRREIEAVARLDHPGVVTVYSAGEEKGIPFFTMEYVEGASLDQLLRDVFGTPAQLLSGSELRMALERRTGGVCSTAGAELFSTTWIDFCFSLVLQVVEALDHAHGRGVLHRDVKPSNVMLTLDGRARLLDFGLARSESVSELTASGTLLGSLPYMAPEQVCGERDRIDARTDVYSVGVMLYELLTTESPYLSDTAAGTRERILAAAPVQLRKRNTAVPWDAETVCLTAMDRDRRRRYPSMAAFAGDLRRYLAREPIQACRPGIFLRTRRWVQRRPARAVAVAAGLLVAIGGPTGYLMVDRAAAERDAARSREQREHERAELSLDDAIAATESLLAQTEDPGLVATPGIDPVRQRLLEEALKLYERLLAREGDNSRIAYRVARAQWRVADLRRQLGLYDEAAAAMAVAIRSCEELRRRTGDGEPGRHHLDHLHGRILHSAMVLASRSGDPAEAVRFADRLAALLPVRAAEIGDADEAWLQAAAWSSINVARQNAGRLDEALEGMKESAELVRELVRRYPDRVNILYVAACTMQVTAYFRGFFRRSEPYAPRFQEALQWIDRALELTEPGPQPPRILIERAGIYTAWAHLDRGRGELSDAVERSRQAGTVYEELHRSFPERVDYLTRLLSNSHMLGYCLSKTDRMEAERVLRKGLETGTTGLARFPSATDIEYRTAILASELARVIELGDREATELWQRSARHWEKLTEGDDSNPRHIVQAGTFYDLWARSERDHARLDRALELATTACSFHERAMEYYPREPQHRHHLGVSRLLMAELHAAHSEPEVALAAVRAAMEAGVDRDSLVKSVALQEALGGREDFRVVIEGRDDR